MLLQVKTMAVELTSNHISFGINWEESLSALKQLGDHPNVDKWSNSLRSFAVSTGERSESTANLD